MNDGFLEQNHQQLEKLLEGMGGSTQRFNYDSDMRGTMKQIVEKIAIGSRGYDMRFMLAGIVVLVIVAVGCIYLWKVRISAVNVGCLALWLLYIVSAGGSSFVEEEHQLVYFFTTTLLISHSFAVLAPSKTIPTLILVAIYTKWNQTGNKWQGAPDLASWIQHHNFEQPLWIASVVALDFIQLYLYSDCLSQPLKLLELSLFMIATSGCILYKLGHVGHMDPVLFARYLLLGILVLVFVMWLIHRLSKESGNQDQHHLKRLKTLRICTVLSLFAMLINKDHNAPIYVFFMLQSLFLSQGSLPTIT